jgi:hypothetical protein
MRTASIRFAVAALALLPAVAAAQGDQPPDLAALIECRADLQAWNGPAFSLMGGPGAVEALGWTARPSDNPFLQEYDLPAPIHAFGRETSRIALTATGPMAVFGGMSPAGLATELGVTPIVTSPEKFVGEKVVVDKREDDGGTVLVTRVTLNVSSVTTHPGLTLAGCSYVLETAAAQ